MFDCCSGVIVLPSISAKTDSSFPCCTSFFIPCATCCGSNPSVSCMIGSSRILSLLISSASSLDVVCICLPSFVANSMAFILILLFGCSDVGGRSSACLPAVVRCCFPALPSAIASSLSLAGDVGSGAGSDGCFWCVGDVAMGDVGSFVLFCFVG